MSRRSANFRTSSNLPGRVKKHGSYAKSSHVTSNVSPKSHFKHGGEKREKTDHNISDNHHQQRHRKVLKTRSHTTHKSSRKQEWNEFNSFDFNPNSLQNKIKQESQFQNSNKVNLHETKSDFCDTTFGHTMPEKQIGPLPGILTLSNNLLANASSASNNGPKISSKQPLKKSNTFPYEKLHSDTTSYSSSENESIGCEKNHQESNIHNLDFKNSNEDETHFDEDVFVDLAKNIRKR